MPIEQIPGSISPVSYEEMGCSSGWADEMGVTRATLYRYVGPKGELRAYGKKVLK